MTNKKNAILVLGAKLKFSVIPGIMFSINSNMLYFQDLTAYNEDQRQETPVTSLKSRPQEKDNLLI